MNSESVPELYLVKAFTKQATGGNAAGVVLFADKLSKDRKQQIAASLGFSETAFVSASAIGDAKVEFFTPNRQIPHCGHATVATFGLLVEKNLVQEPSAVKESIEGPRQIDLLSGKVYQSQLAPTYNSLTEVDMLPSEVASALGLTADYAFPAEPVVANTGVSFLLVQVPDEETLKALQPLQDKIAAISEKLDLVGFYVFTTATAQADATARMFAPAYGIPEESATGMAAGPLACYLYDFLNFKKQSFLLHQGYLMQLPSPSQIEVKLQLDAQEHIAGLKAGGHALVVKQLELAQL